MHLRLRKDKRERERARSEIANERQRGAPLRLTITSHVRDRSTDENQEEGLSQQGLAD